MDEDVFVNSGAASDGACKVILH